MDLGSSLLLWLVIVVVLWILFYAWLSLKWYSSLAIALIVGALVLNSVYYVPQIGQEKNGSAVGLFGLISFLSGIYLLFYIVYSALNQRRV